MALAAYNCPTMPQDKTKSCKLLRNKRQPNIGPPCSVCHRGPCSLLTPDGGGKRRRGPGQVPHNGTFRTYPRVRTRVDGEKEITITRAVKSSGGPLVVDSGVLASVPMEWSGFLEYSRNPSGGASCKNIHIFNKTPSNEQVVYQTVWSGFDSFNQRFVPLDYLVSVSMQELINSQWTDSAELVDEYIRETLRIPRAIALKTMTPSLSTGFSVINFLIELRDFKSWFDGSILTRTGRSIRELVRRPFAGYSEVAAELALAYNFAILPTISDINKIINILGNFSVRTARFLGDADRLVTRRHYRRAVQVSTELSQMFETRDVAVSLLPYEDIFVGSVALRSPKFEPQTTSSSTTPAGHFNYNALMDYDYTVSKLVECNSYVLSLFQQFGVKPDASIIWNAIPFSFVVDWFIRIGDFLETYASVDLIAADISIHDWLESYRLRLSLDLHLLSNDEWSPSSSVATSVIGLELYRRYPALPDVDGMIPPTLDDGLTLRNIGLSSALLRKAVR